MSRKQPNSKRTLGVDRHISPRIAFQLPQALYDVFREHVEGIKPKTTLSAAVLLAVEEYLEARKLWPPKEAKPSQEGEAKK